jgi:hypothetical protein
MPNASGGYDFTQIAEIYVNFGWAGIATVPILSGILLRALDTLVARGRAEPIMLLWFATAGFESAGVVLAPYGFGTYDLILYSVLSLTLGHMLRPHQPAMQPSKVLDTAS